MIVGKRLTKSTVGSHHTRTHRPRRRKFRVQIERKASRPPRTIRLAQRKTHLGHENVQRGIVAGQTSGLLQLLDGLAPTTLLP